MTEGPREAAGRQRDRKLEAESRRLAEIYGAYERTKEQAWGPENPGNSAMRDALLERILAAARREIDRQADVLDVGCGSGWWLQRLSDAGLDASRLHGIDAIEGRIEAGNERLPDADLRVGDARSLPHPDEAFGLVMFVSVLSDLPGRDDVEAALSEAVRVLDRDGLLLCYEPRMPNPFNPAVHRIPGRSFKRTLGSDWRATPLTVLPPLSHRLGRLTPRLYPLLAKVRPLLSHRLIEYRKPA